MIYKYSSIFVLMLGLVLFFTLSVSGEIFDDSKADTSQIPAKYFTKAQKELKIICFVSDSGIALSCENSSIRVDGKTFTCNSGGFGNALHAKNYRFGKDVLRKVSKGKTTWEEQISAVLRNPVNKGYNVVVWAGSPEGDAGSYLNAMITLSRKYPSRRFVCMTGTLDADTIRKGYRRVGSYLLDAATLKGDRKYVEWHLWARLAGWRHGGILREQPRQNITVENLSIAELLQKAERAEKTKEFMAAYVYYREAIRRAGEMDKLPFDLDARIRKARIHIRSLEIHREVKEEIEAAKDLSRGAGGIRNDLQDAVEKLKRVAEDNPGTYTSLKASDLANQLNEVLNSLKE